MIISKIVLDNCLYYHLHAEQTITAAFLDGRNMGILEESVTDTTFNNVIEDYKSNKEDNNKVLVINFDGIKAIQNNQLSKIVELKKLNKNLVLINIQKEIINELKLNSLFDSRDNIINISGNYDVFYCFDPVNLIIEYSTENIFQSHFLKLIRDKYTDSLDGKDKYHSSSSVYLLKWINIKKFISVDKEFFLYSIYHLALKTYQKWFKEGNFNDEMELPVLVCQNLNSSYIASILSTLLGVDILILDQIGPINKMYSTLDSKIENGRKYIVVSDLVCLGTEIKIAKSLIEFLGGKYLGNISIVRIQTIDPQHRSFEDTECVFIVDKKNNAEIGYEIKTDLDSE
jgi:hypothetical protein